jgi:ATP-dependent helicase/DNAse subunit B
MDSVVETVRSRSHAVLRNAVENFAARFQESLILLPSGAATFPPNGNALGVHRLTLLQFARQVAQARMAELGLAPLTRLGAEALSAHVVFEARRENTLRYFEPVEELPGFARALARTLRDLRLAGTSAEQLEAGAAPARDLARLLTAYEDQLEARALADPALIFELAREAVEQGEHRWAKLPVALLDVVAETRAHGALIDALLSRSPEVLMARSGEDETEPTSSLDHLRRYLFHPAPPACAHDDGAFELFSAPGEGLESVEIARRILRLAREGVKFDEIAILLRNPERYQPVIEDALRRAEIPGYFSRGAVRPDPAGRAFLALLGCAVENLSASRFAEYLSLGQLPQTPVAKEWVEPSGDEQAYDGPDNEAPEPQRATPRRWEQYLVDAAVIGGRDRWESRLRGLEEEWEMNPDVDPERIAQLRNLRAFALPLIEALANLPHKDEWSVWLAALRELARQSLRSPEPVWAALAELEPMSAVGPVSLEEVTEVLGDHLRFLRREPPARRWGRVFVASIDEARGHDFRVVFLPGLAEGLFPRKLSEDPLLLDDFRREVDENLSLRTDLVDEERERLRRQRSGVGRVRAASSGGGTREAELARSRGHGRCDR